MLILEMNAEQLKGIFSTCNAVFKTNKLFLDQQVLIQSEILTA